MYFATFDQQQKPLDKYSWQRDSSCFVSVFRKARLAPLVVVSARHLRRPQVSAIYSSTRWDGSLYINFVGSLVTGMLENAEKWMEQMVEMVGQRCPTHCFWQFQTSQLWNKNTTSCLSYHVHHVNIWQNDVTSYMGWDSRTWYWVKGPGNMNAR